MKWNYVWLIIYFIIHKKLRGNIIQGTCSGDQIKVYIIQGKFIIHNQFKGNIIWGKGTLFGNDKIYYPQLTIIFYRIHLIWRIRQKSKQK